ncbi:MAG: DUF1328 domain-containing protein [Isosphaeraceae bacterium]
MLQLAAVFLVIVLIAALFGFGSFFSFSWDGAGVLFYIFTVLAVLSLVGGAYGRRAYLN